MAILNADLTKVQIGPESTAGTLVAATRLVPFTGGSYTPKRERNAVEEMRGIMADYEDVLVRQGAELQLTQELDLENIIPAFECAFAAETATGSDPYTWEHIPGRTAPAALASATFEIAETDGASANYRGRFGYARPTTLSIEVGADGTAQLQTTWMGRAEQALTSPASVSALERTILPVALFECYIDDSWAALGTTKVGQLRSCSIEYVPGLTPAYNQAGRDDLDMTGWYRSRFQGSLALSIDHDGDDHFGADGLEGGHAAVYSAAGHRLVTHSLTLDHCVRYIETPDILASDNKQHTLELTGHLRADTTAAANLFEATVVNGIDAW